MAAEYEGKRTQSEGRCIFNVWGFFKWDAIPSFFVKCSKIIAKLIWIHMLILIRQYKRNYNLNNKSSHLCISNPRITVGETREQNGNESMP